MTTKTDEQLRADFEAWANGRCELHLVNPAGRYSSAITQFAWEAYQAGRAALQSQSMPSEISRDLLGRIVDQVFDGAIEDTAVIEDIYRVIDREFAMQSQDAEDAERYRALRAAATEDDRSFIDAVEEYAAHNFADRDKPTADEFDASIDHARRIEGEGNG